MQRPSNAESVASGHLPAVVPRGGTSAWHLPARDAKVEPHRRNDVQHGGRVQRESDSTLMMARKVDPRSTLTRSVMALGNAPAEFGRHPIGGRVGTAYGDTRPSLLGPWKAHRPRPYPRFAAFASVGPAEWIPLKLAG
jgi:hypothetical protein